MGELQLALLQLMGAGKGAFLMAEQIAFEEFFGEAGAVDGDEGF